MYLHVFACCFFVWGGGANLKDRFENWPGINTQSCVLRWRMQEHEVQLYAWGLIWELGCVCHVFVLWVVCLVWWCIDDGNVFVFCGSFAISQTVEFKNLRRRSSPSMANQRGWPSSNLWHPLASFDLSGSCDKDSSLSEAKSRTLTHRVTSSFSFPQRLGMVKFWRQISWLDMAIRGRQRSKKVSMFPIFSHASCARRCFFLSNSSVQVVDVNTIYHPWSMNIHSISPYRIPATPPNSVKADRQDFILFMLKVMNSSAANVGKWLTRWRWSNPRPSVCHVWMMF